MSGAAIASPGDSGAWKPGLLSWLLIPSSLAVAVLLALNPLTAIFMLGWLVRLMQRETAIAVMRELHRENRSEAKRRLAAKAHLAALAPWTGWLFASASRKSWFGRNFGGLMESAQAGLAASLGLMLATLPFTALLLLSWWAGWENSFNKGYEQAWAGPLIALTGIAIGLFVLIHLPMAFAHFAAERRISAIFELGTIRALIRVQRWRYLWLAVVAVLAALPIAAAQILPVFIENGRPGFADMPPEVIEATARWWHVMPTVYLIVALIFLRRAQARCYARAAIALPRERTPFCHSIDQQMGAATNGGLTPQAKRGWSGSIIPTLLLIATWSAFIAQIYIAQFANHAWWNWINHPLIGLPWVFQPL
jgi:hypothetical protein